MKKRLLCILTICVLMCQTLSVCAIDSKKVYKEIKYYTAKIFVCDTQNTKAILLNVMPQEGNYSLNMVRDIEYRALPLCTNRVFGAKGQNLSMQVINEYLLDSPVKVLIGKNGYGYEILYMEFLR